MHQQDAKGHLATLRSALARSVEAVPAIVVAGLVAFAPLGDGMAGLGVMAAFLSAVMVSGAIALIADRPGLGAGPSMGMALIIAGVLSNLEAEGLALEASPGTGILIAMVLTLGSGLLLAAAAVLGTGRLAPLVPYPVVAGLRNGTALLLITEQAYAALGMSESGHGTIHPGALLVTAVTLGAMVWSLPALRALPQVAVAVLAGLATHYLLWMLPWSDWLLGPVMEAAAHGQAVLPAMVASLDGLAGLPLTAIGQVLLPALLSMTLLGLLETVASASALQGATGQRGSGRGDLLAIGAANVAGGALGALPAAGSIEDAIPDSALEAHPTRPVALLRAGMLLAIALLAMPLLAWLPQAMLAGIIIAAGFRVSDVTGLRQLVADARAGRRQRVEAIGSLLVMLGVVVVAVAFGLVTAVICGVLLSLLIFVVEMARGPVRRRYDCPLGRSRAKHGELETETLLREGGAIEVIELHGALFFGSCEAVAEQIEAAFARPGRYLVLDVARVHRMDLSAARGLLSICERQWKAGHALLLAGMRPGLAAFDYLTDRRMHHRLPPERVFSALEDAIACAELMLLEARLGRMPQASLDGPQALARLGIPEAAAAPLLARMVEVCFGPGERIIQRGDTSREVFVLLEGRVDVSIPVAGERSTRIATLAPGALFGEMALLSHAPRSADLVAHGVVRCLRLDADGLEALRETHPDSAWHLLRAIAVQIELNLRLANAAIASYEE